MKHKPDHISQEAWDAVSSPLLDVRLYRRVEAVPEEPGSAEEATKRLFSLRLDPDIVERFRATGPGWQSRINDTLREHLPE